MNNVKIFDFRMHDCSRHFADLPEIASFASMRSNLKRFEGAEETGFLTDEVTEMWLDFDYREHRFSINNQHGWYWFFVEDPKCPEPILFDVVQHFAKINVVKKRIAYYGGTFDPVHCGHITVAKRLLSLFRLDEFVFLPAFHAPHKADKKPTSAYHRFAMLALATASERRISISTLELDRAEKRYTVETLPEVIDHHPDTEIFFVMGADSWADILTWREWEKVLLMTNHIVVTRPGYEIGFDHVSDAVRSRIVDMRGSSENPSGIDTSPGIFITDAVSHDVSATEIREDIREDDRLDRDSDVPVEVAKYIEKYELYK